MFYLFFALLVLAGSTLADIADLLKDADAAFSRGEYNMAIRVYSSAIELDPKASILYTKRAAAYMSSRQASQALRDLNQAIENDSAFIQGYITRGKLHRQMCNTASAQRDFNKVLELRPDSKTAGGELEKSNRIEELLASLEAQFSSPDAPAPDDAIWSKYLQEIYDLAQDCAKAQVMEAKLLLQRGDWDQVVATTGRLLKNEPSNLQALVLRGQGYFYSGDHDLAKRHYGEALKYDPDHKEAKAEFSKVKEYDRKKGRAQNALAEQDWAQAESLFSDALNLDPKHGQGNKILWQGIGEARFHQGKWDTALEGFNSVLYYERESENAMTWVIKTLLAAERWQEAVNKAKEFVGEHQQSGQLRQLLQEAEKKLKMSLRKDYYKVLGVDKSVGDRELKRAYRDLAKQFHPDKVSGEEEKKVAEARFRDIAEAYEVLTDEEKRQRYDRGEDIDQPQGQQGNPFHGFQQGGGNFHFNFQWG